jgi:predicted RNase H-like nuclease (RuvC/YqgF family)|tara:strand:- start:53 stop:433 length:381 start_codon:yes stop_codon:yes gene_type:complete
MNNINPLGKTYAEYTNDVKRIELEKAIKIKLSKVDDIDEIINRGLSLFEFVENDLDEAFTLYIRAKDAVRFDMNDAYTEAEDLLNKLESDIKELGIDMPSDIKNLRKGLNDLEKEIKEAEQRIKNF